MGRVVSREETWEFEVSSVVWAVLRWRFMRQVRVVRGWNRYRSDIHDLLGGRDSGFWVGGLSDPLDPRLTLGLVFGSDVDHVGILCMVFSGLGLGIGRVGLVK